MPNRWDLQNYISFITRLILGFGIAFELPIVMAFLSRIGVINARGFREKQNYALLGICVILSTADPCRSMVNAIDGNTPLPSVSTRYFFRLPRRKGVRSIMANTSLRQQLALLYQLQERDSELLTIQQKLQDIPNQIEQQQADFAKHEVDLGSKIGRTRGSRKNTARQKR